MSDNVYLTGADFGGTFPKWATEETLSSMMNFMKKQGIRREDVRELKKAFGKLFNDQKAATSHLDSISKTIKNIKNQTKQQTYQEKQQESRQKTHVKEKSSGTAPSSVAKEKKTYKNEIKESQLKLKAYNEILMESRDPFKLLNASILSNIESYDKKEKKLERANELYKEQIDSLKQSHNTNFAFVATMKELISKKPASLFLGPLSLLGGAVSSVASLITGVLTAALRGMVDAIKYITRIVIDSFHAYNELYNTGVMLQGGFAGLTLNAARLGMNMEQLADVIGEHALVIRNVGINQFRRGVHEIINVTDAAGGMNLKLQEATEYFGNYLEVQRRMGVIQQLTQDEMQQAAAENIERFTMLSRAMLVNRREIEEATRRVLSDELMVGMTRRLRADARGVFTESSRIAVQTLSAMGESGQDMASMLGQMVSMPAAAMAEGFGEIMAAAPEVGQNLLSLSERIRRGEELTEEDIFPILRNMGGSIEDSVERLHILSASGNQAATSLLGMIPNIEEFNREFPDADTFRRDAALREDSQEGIRRLNRVWDLLINTGQALIGRVLSTGGFQDMIGSLTDRMSRLLENVDTLAQSFGEKMEPLMDSFGDWLENMIVKMFNWVENLLEGDGESLWDKASGLMDNFVEVIGNMVESLKRIPDIIDSVLISLDNMPGVNIEGAEQARRRQKIQTGREIAGVEGLGDDVAERIAKEREVAEQGFWRGYGRRFRDADPITGGMFGVHPERTIRGLSGAAWEMTPWGSPQEETLDQVRAQNRQQEAMYNQLMSMHERHERGEDVIDADSEAAAHLAGFATRDIDDLSEINTKQEEMLRAIADILGQEQESLGDIVRELRRLRRDAEE